MKAQEKLAKEYVEEQIRCLRVDLTLAKKLMLNEINRKLSLYEKAVSDLQDLKKQLRKRK